MTMVFFYEDDDGFNFHSRRQGGTIDPVMQPNLVMVCTSLHLYIVNNHGTKITVSLASPPTSEYSWANSAKAQYQPMLKRPQIRVIITFCGNPVKLQLNPALPGRRTGSYKFSSTFYFPFAHLYAVQRWFYSLYMISWNVLGSWSVWNKKNLSFSRLKHINSKETYMLAWMDTGLTKGRCGYSASNMIHKLLKFICFNMLWCLYGDWLYGEWCVALV